MENSKKKFKNIFLKHAYLYSFIIVALIGAGSYAVFGKNNSADEKLIDVKKGTVSQKVSVTGKVKPANEVELSFEKSGRVSGVYKKVGDIVSDGDLIASIDNSDLSASLSQAEANVKAEQARLEQLKNGTREEELNVSEIEVENAKQGVVDAQGGLSNNIQDAYTKSDDAIRNKVDQFISNGRGSTPQLNFIVSDNQLKNDIELGRVGMEKTLSDWKSEVDNISSTTDVSILANNTKVRLQKIQSFLDGVSVAVNYLTVSSYINQTTIDSYKSSVSTARTNTNTALSNVSTALEKLQTANSNLNLANSQLSLKKAGSVKEVVSAQEAQVEAQLANVQNIKAQISKTLIRSPISGIITKQEAKRGQIAVANNSIVSIISLSQFEIEANVPEADIAKVRVGDIAQVTLDAYGSDVLFDARVTSIDPAETVIDGVSTYKTTLQFVTNDKRIRSGMTANTDISGEIRENVLYIPGRYINTENGVKNVKIKVGEETKVIEIRTGLRGSNGDIEILSGLSEGDKVLAE